MNKRIFAALDISSQARAAAADFIESLRRRFPAARAGWDKPEKLHLTLKFLGEIDDERLESFQIAAKDAARQISPFKLRIAGTGVFPSAKRARVLWLGVAGEVDELGKLNEALEKECARRGFAREKRRFKAHLTIARLKESHAGLIAAHLAENFEPVEFEVSALVIYQSELRPTGSVYSVISKYEFEKSNR